MDRQSMGSLLGNKSGPTSPRKRMSIVQSLKKNTTLSVSGRSNQSAQVICRTSSHVVESFGSSLPVLVTEALTFVDRQTAVSVNVSPDGWAWLVCGRRLLVWQCKTTIHDPKRRSTFKSQCRELLLPQSDLAHRAELAAVWLRPGQRVPGCIAVSPEGTVRYWSSVAHEGSSVETSAELAGQEVDRLTHVPGHGCILATTTCTVVLLQPRFVSGRNEISCRVLRAGQGWLGGIGRRMSSLIFGAIPQSPVAETKLVKVTCGAAAGDRDSRVLILAGSSLQYWSFPHGDQEKMEFDEDIGHAVSQAFQRRFWESSACNPNNVTTWLIDMQPCDEGIVLLMAAHCADLSPLIHSAIGLLPLSRTALTNSFKWFTPVKMGLMSYDSENEETIESAIFSHRFILSGWEAIIYNHRRVIVINTMNEHDQDKIDLMRDEEDRILGGALCSGTPVLFTRKLALVTVMPTDFSSHDLDGSYLAAGNGVDNNSLNNSTGQTESFVCAVSDEKLQDMYYSSDAVHQLSAAFLLALRRNRAECENILSELFPLQDEPIMDIDANLDTIVLKVAKNVIDDYPANDPRWSNRRDFSSTMNAVFSVQIPPQLEGKQKALDLYVTFLKEENLWNRFCAVTYRGIVMSTAHVLGEYAEKIVAASTLYNLQIRYPEILDPMIEATVNHNVDNEPGLSEEITARDIFFRQVSTVDRVLHALVDSAADKARSENSSQQVSQYIHRANCILLGVLREVIKYRQRNAERYVPSGCTNGITEYLPWTAAPGKQGLRGCLSTMQSLTLKHDIGGSIDSSLRNELSEQLVGLIDLILDGRKCHLESLRGTEKFDILLKQYETERTNLLQPLIKDKRYENAAMVAEKYLDFACLVQICELTENKARLNNYMERFAAQDFVGFMFSWYVKNGRQGQLVERCRRPGAVELTEILSEHPSLSWVQAGLTGEYRSAANTLHHLAHNEIELVRRKKTMLSLSKLAILASNEDDDDDDDDDNEEVAEDLEIINNQLKLIEHQEDVSESVLEAYGYDTNKMRVLSAVELVTLYTCEENVLANEYDFKKALDLLEHVEPEEERSVLKLKIWARAVRRDRCWDTLAKNPEQRVTETLFFKLIDLCHTIGCRTKDFLPPVALLLSEPEIGTLAASNSFQYLIKFVYEYAHRVFGISS